MIKVQYIVCCIASALFLSSCDKILEPITFSSDNQDIATMAGQEEFEINIKSLTFDSAKKANNAPYSRRLVLTGSGSSANIIDEAYFLESSFPVSSGTADYLLGIGDHISFSQLNEFMTKTAKWPTISKVPEYLLGAGDILNLAQSNDINRDISVTMGQNGQIIPSNKDSTGLILTQGVVGSNGNVLLFGLGNIAAANRTLEDVRTEVRNILIRNGLAPNFQLEISEFRSQKAFVTLNINGQSSGENEIIFLNNIKTTLQELALGAGLSKSDKNFALIKLMRDEQEYRLTAEQLFDLAAPEIIIQDNDQISIQLISEKSTKVQTVVGSKGNILLPNFGSLSVVNRSIDDIYEEIRSILISKGLKPSFQIELINFISKKIYLIQNNAQRVVVPLTSSNTNLRQFLFENNNPSVNTDSLSVITLKRNGQEFRMTRDQILDTKTPNIWIADEDQIEIENLTYKPGQVFALSGAGNAEMVTISPSKRETLADILFTPRGALNNLMAKRSEVYLLRGQNPSVAYHLDAQNVSRILVAAKTELRPNDIIYVADRPIISFARTLSEISPLRALLRDIKNDNIP